MCEDNKTKKKISMQVSNEITLASERGLKSTSQLRSAYVKFAYSFCISVGFVPQS